MMRAMERVPSPVWRLGAAVFFTPAALLPVVAWRLHLVRLLPYWAAGPGMVVGALAALSWLGAGALCLALARRGRPHPGPASRRAPFGTVPHAHRR